MSAAGVLASTGTSPRDSTIDIAKGLAIIAIVTGHVLRGLATAGILDGTAPTFLLTDRLLYLVHLPVFAFLGGLFIQRSVERVGAGAFLRHRDTTFLYLYVIWSVLQGGIKVLTGSLVNSPVSPLDVLRLWEPDGQLWYLPFLIMATTVIALVAPWRSRRRAIALLASTGVLALASWGTESAIAGANGLALLLFMSIGATIGAPRLSHLVARAPVGGVAAVGSLGLVVWVGLAPLATSPTVSDPDRTWVSVALGCAASFGGVCAVIATARLLTLVGPMADSLSFLGRRSLEIFLGHIIAASAARIGLQLLGIDSPALQLGTGVAVGVLAPLALWGLCRRLRFPWLFIAPGPGLSPRRVERAG